MRCGGQKMLCLFGASGELAGSIIENTNRVHDVESALALSPESASVTLGGLGTPPSTCTHRACETNAQRLFLTLRSRYFV